MVKENDELLKDFSLLMIPFSLHNHHMTMFCKKVNDIPDPNLAMYIFRQGFSTHMNPVIFDLADGPLVKNDLNALYAIFIKYISRALLFNEFHREPKPKKEIEEICKFDIGSPGIEKVNPFNTENLAKVKGLFEAWIIK